VDKVDDAGGEHIECQMTAADLHRSGLRSLTAGRALAGPPWRSTSWAPRYLHTVGFCVPCTYRASE
jgi:hypothetical protein